MYKPEERNSVQEADERGVIIKNGASYDKNGNLLATEKLIYNLYKINTENLINIKIHLAKEFHIMPSEIDRMKFFEYEIMLEQVNILAKEQEEEQKKQQEDMDNMRSSMNPNKMMASMGQQMSQMKTPSMPKISIPKL